MLYTINLPLQVSNYASFVGIVVAFWIAGFALRYLINRYVAGRLGAGTADVVIRNSSSSIVLWSVLVGIYIGAGFLGLSDGFFGYLSKAIFVVATISITLVSAHILSDLLKKWGAELGPQTAPITGLGQSVLKIIILAIGITVILGTLGVQISPVLASLGVAALAIALALQPTLANLFAGVYLMADRPIRVGDFIKLESGEEGYVEDIGWRSVKVKLLPNNTVIIPNQKLAESVVLNYYYPERRMALRFEIGVSYEDDPVKVEKILIEEMTKASFEVDGMVTAYEMKPFVRFMPGYMDFSLNFTIICQVREFVDNYYVQHELRKRIWERFKKEGVNIPFPIRTLHFPEKYYKDLKKDGLFEALEGRNE